ncbi:fluoride efflux transporter FluC [Cellulomonas soli]
MTTRAAHLTPSLILLVGLGGALGTGARYALTSAAPVPDGGWPAATFTENLLGAFLLGLLLESLVRRGPESTGIRRLRLTLGTGVLGGFTTFSTLAIEVERLGAAGHVGTALTYALASVVLGFLTALGGVLLGARRHARRSTRRAGAPHAPEASS